MTSTSNTPPPPERPRVLVVEDDVVLLRMASLIFEGAGYQVEQARDAEEALIKARPPRVFDLLFTDVIMTDRTGLELAALLRAEQPALAVLITTGQFDAAVRRSVERSGHHVLRKPYTAPALLAAAQLARTTGDAGDEARSS
ncbi:MAG: sensory box histidine kinaseresponse regulator [Acidimicrobiales bacterium]|nr:sensory box histidine kinaseresponse regulator [Acidimicrobiales bacterium]